jgi:hypothetical protein
MTEVFAMLPYAAGPFAADRMASAIWPVGDQLADCSGAHDVYCLTPAEGGDEMHMRIVWGKILPGQWDAFEAAFKKALEIRGAG